MNDDFLKELWEAPSDEFKTRLYAQLQAQDQGEHPMYQATPLPARHSLTPQWRYMRWVASLVLATMLGAVVMALFSAGQSPESAHLQAMQVTATPTLEPTPTISDSPYPAAKMVQEDNLHFEAQTWNGSAASAVSMAMAYYGYFYESPFVHRELAHYTADINVSVWEILNFANNETGAFDEDLYSAYARIGGDMDTIRLLINEGLPVIVEIGEAAPNYAPPIAYATPQWHARYTLVVGYDDTTQEVILYDSYRGFDNGVNYRLAYDQFDDQWRQFNHLYVVIADGSHVDVTDALFANELSPEASRDRAEVRARAEIAANAEDVWAWFNLGDVMLERGDYDEAVRTYETALALEFPQQLLLYRPTPFEAYHHVGDYTKLNRLLLRHGGGNEKVLSEELFYYMALVMISRGDMDEARDYLELTLDLNPNYMLAEFLLADLP